MKQVGKSLYVILPSDNSVKKYSDKIQQKLIKGKVTDASSGDPLPGVNVVVKSTTIGTATNKNGNYSLQVPESADTLVFSYIGYKRQYVAIQGRSIINVKLSSQAVKGQQVVVTALGLKRNPRDLGYSVSSVSGQKLAAIHAINPVSALQGQAAGIDINNSDGGVFGGSAITIRGESTLSGNNMPIFVVDGVILQDKTSGGSEWNNNPGDYGNQIRNINPNNIQSVSILKGAAATALYGSQALNGAVVITTKSGHLGQGIGVTVNETAGMNYAYAGPKFQNEYGPGPLAGYVSYGKKNSSGNYYRFDTNQFYTNTLNGQQVPSLIGWFTGPAYGMAYGPKFSSKSQIEGFDKTMVPYKAYPNNFLNAFRKGFYNSTNVTINGGTSKGTYYFNFGTKVNNGINPRTKISDYSGLLKSTYNITKNLKIHGSVSYMRSIPQNPPTTISDGFLYDFSRAYNTKKYDKPSVFIATNGGVPSTANGDKYGNVPDNSLWFGIYENNQEHVENTWRPIVSVTANPTDWLSLTLNGNMNLYNYTYTVQDLGQGYNNKGGSYTLEHDSQNEYTGKFMAKAKRDFKNFGVNATFGGQIYHNKSEQNGAHTNGGLVVPGQYFLGNSMQTLTNYQTPSANTEKQINSLFALVSLSWKNQLYLDLTGRNDWSSALVYANGSGNYSYFYPSASLSWIFNETLDLPSWISFGKLRASVAKVGNDTSPYSINQGYGLNSIQTSTGYIYTNSVNRTLISPNLKPEQKRSYEFGTNLRFFNNRIGLNFTYYKDNTFNQILNIPAPQVSGATAQKINAGNIQNQGIEASLKLVPVITSDFNWNLKFNYTRNRNKIISLHSGIGKYERLAGYPNYGNYRIGSAAYIGGSYGALLSDILPATNSNGQKVLEYDSYTRSAYYKRSGTIQKVGSIQPDFLGNVKSTFQYKNISFSFMINSRFGGDVASFENRYGTAWGLLATSLPGRDAAHGGITWTSQYPDTKGETFHDGVIPKGVFAQGTTVQTPNGNSVDVSGMTYEQAYKKGYIEPSHASATTYWDNSWSRGTINSNWFYSLSYVQLRNISINYALPARTAHLLGAQRIRLGLESTNVLYFYNSSPNNMNPQSQRGNQTDYSYFERTANPYARSIFFNINLSF
ncbi:MAG TPA: SusC/RagA family TonB-linked outer membrane protein [Bacteroidales bacterium]|nr:SusC/RagA family TonB-linked outer membrane protein [Bacteroidales bacterium]